MAASMWWTRARINRLGVIVGCCGFAVAALAWWCPARVILQGRPVHSVPFHLAIRLKAPAVWERGQLVEFAVRDLHPYYPAGTPFTKVVTGVEGDRLQLDGRVFRINGTVIGTALTTDSRGQPAWLYAPQRLPDGTCSLETRLPTGLGSAECVLPAGTLFVLGVHARSFDSRYIGLVQAAEVKGRVVPLL